MPTVNIDINCVDMLLSDAFLQKKYDYIVYQDIK